MAVRITSHEIGTARGLSDAEASERIQVGDSRVYLLRNGELLQLTKDHSFAQELVDAGLLTPGQARVHPYSNMITRSVGVSGDVVPDVYFGTPKEGDILLLASDGLTGMLEDEHLIRILSSDAGPRHWVDRMITEANRRGGLDNITAIVIRIESVEESAAEQPAVMAAAGGGGFVGRPCRILPGSCTAAPGDSLDR